ncbi:MAG: ABC-F family ATP-binding cassette domain-containing protein [bacterium]|nr:ABC-F family ATP-binding cassette domain-containing protein [bacterium]
MPPLLKLENVTKMYGTTVVLNDISLVLTDRARIGVVGTNGVGKSTLLNVVAGALPADSGTIWRKPGLRIGLLGQAPTLPTPDATLADLITFSLENVRALEARLRDLEIRMAASEVVNAAEPLATLLDEYASVTDLFERAGGYSVDNRAETLFRALSVDVLPHERPFALLSGGEKSRVALALLLLHAPDLLLLDEPTNHLDRSMLTWLENTLLTYAGAALIASHDREFLNRVVTGLAELDEHTHTARLYAGNYDDYREAKNLERRQWQETFAMQQAEMRRLKLQAAETARRNDNYRAESDGDKMAAKARKATHEATVSRRVRDSKMRLARLLDEAVEAPPHDLTFTATFSPERTAVGALITLSGVCKQYDGRTILDDVSLILDSRSRVALVGENGAGKTTLLRILAGNEKPDAGEVWHSHAARIGYLDQEQEMLNLNRGMFESDADGQPLFGLDEQAAKSFLLYYHLFRATDLNKRMNELSLGQRRKWQVARLMAMRANVLVLDEPTNHLSFDVLEGLEAALQDFPGAVIAATHDRRFLQVHRAWQGDVYRLTDGHLIRE